MDHTHLILKEDIADYTAVKLIDKLLNLGSLAARISLADNKVRGLSGTLSR